MYAWSQTVTEIVDSISKKYDLEWDTDTNIQILINFIEENCDPSKFENHVIKVAEMDLRFRSALNRSK